MVRYPAWLRVFLWLLLAVGALMTVLGLAGLAYGPDRGFASLLLAVGVVLSVVGGLFGVRAGVRCDREGVRLCLIRTTFVPAGEIGSIRIRPVAGSPGLSRAMIVLVRRDGSEVRLEPTLTVRTTQASVDARMQALVSRMTAVLSLESPTGPNQPSGPRQGPPPSH